MFFQVRDEVGEEGGEQCGIQDVPGEKEGAQLDELLQDPDPDLHEEPVVAPLMGYEPHLPELVEVIGGEGGAAEAEPPLELPGPDDPIPGVQEGPVGPQGIPPQLAGQLLLVEFSHLDGFPHLGIQRERNKKHTTGHI